MKVLVPMDIDLEGLVPSAISHILEIIHYEITDIDFFFENAPKEVEKIVRAIGKKLTEFDWEKWEKEMSE